MDPRNVDQFERSASEELIELRAENARLHEALARRSAEDAVCEWIQYLNQIDDRLLETVPRTLTIHERRLLDQIRLSRNQRVHPYTTIQEVARMVPLLPAGSHRDAAVKMLRILRYFTSLSGCRIATPPFTRRAARMLQHRIKQLDTGSHSIQSRD